MINIDRFKQAFDAYVMKNTRGTTAPKIFNQAVNVASREKFMFDYGGQPEYLNGRPIPRTGGAERTEKVSDDLAPFKVSNQEVNKTSGNFLHPTGFAHLLAVYFIRKDGLPVPVQEISEDELGKKLGNINKPPTEDYPIYIQNNGSIKAYPLSINKIAMSYYKNPVDAVWAYTVDTNNRPIYDSVNSVDLQWNETAFNELLIRTLSAVGINLKDNNLVQYAEMKETKGI